jgi:uncharacterized protein YfcZ (UPF0381/DUF406 family)
MKRCPACKRVEPDNALTFCRADETALVSDSDLVSNAYAVAGSREEAVAVLKELKEKYQKHESLGIRR